LWDQILVANLAVNIGASPSRRLLEMGVVTKLQECRSGQQKIDSTNRLRKG
jgi:hypothetical protein